MLIKDCGVENMEFSFSKDLYSKQVLLKTCFHFTDNYYVFLDLADDRFILNIKSKNGVNNPNIKDEFLNELLAQATRQAVYMETKNIREMMMARAISSSIIELPRSENDVGMASEDVFNEWFAEH